MVRNMNVKTTGIEDPSMLEADIDPMDQLESSPEHEASSTVQAVPLPAVSTQSDKFVERIRHAMEQRWCGRQDNNSDGSEDDGDEDDEDEDDEDEDDEDEDDEDEDEDGDEDKDEEDEDYEDENERPGLSAWDLLGEAFEREAAALGLSFVCESATRLKILEMGSLLQNRTSTYFALMYLKSRITFRIAPSADLPRLFRTPAMTP
jgi:hypothetical protein